MPDWTSATLAAYPAIFLMLAGLGLPWALVILPRRDWADRVMVACVTLAFGPALLTAWMFVLGTLGQNHDPHAGDTLNPMQTTLAWHTGGQNLMRPDLILAGVLVIGAMGWGLVWRKYALTTGTGEARLGEACLAPTALSPMPRDEKVLLVMIVVAVALRWVITSWLAFGAYDPLWVYGYQGRLYTLAGYIPADIGYYPQFIPLQYAYTQIVAAGGIDDHAARAVLPFLQVGSLLAVYLLGARLFDRRTGFIAMALWALYPHFGYWTRVGDLEIPVTFALTGAAAFFLMAWTHAETAFRRRYALIAGLFLGVAMWTKPTAGAFILGVMLAVGVDFVLSALRGDAARRPYREYLRSARMEAAIITGLASIPLGAVWYARNVLLGHTAIVFPDDFWPTLAARSGAEFGWPLLALCVLLAYLYFGPVQTRPGYKAGAMGFALVLAGLLPTILEPARMGLRDWLLLGAGGVILAVALADYALVHLSLAGEKRLSVVGWALLLALPYFVVWFRSYSYHYRLSFSIVPLMILPTAVILAQWLTVRRVQEVWRRPLRRVYLLVVFVIALPGTAIAFNDAAEGWDWLWTPSKEVGGEYPKSGLLGVVETLQNYVDTHPESPMAVSAPGLLTLPFFFPEYPVLVKAIPYETHELAGMTHFIESSAARRAYGAPAPGALQNQWYTSLFRENVTRHVAGFHDFTETYDIYELHIDDRFVDPGLDLIAPAGEAVFGGSVRYHGYSIARTTLAPDYNALVMLFEVIEPLNDEYLVYIHLYHPDDPGMLWAAMDGPVKESYYAPTWYSTRFWEAGEFIIDRRWAWQNNRNTPPGDGYRLRMGFYRESDGERLPLTLDGQPAGDGYVLEDVFTVAPWPEG